MNNEEIQQLKQERQTFKECSETWEKYYNKAREEIQQLKQQLSASGSQVSAEGYTVYWFNDEQFVPEWQAKQLQQRMAHLRELLTHKTAMVEHLDQIASDAWRAAVTWERWHYYEEIYGKLMPKDMRNNRPPQLHEYLSRFEQTKTDNI